VLAGECFFTLEWRPLPGQSPERGLALLDEAAGRVAGKGRENAWFAAPSR